MPYLLSPVYTVLRAVAATIFPFRNCVKLSCRVAQLLLRPFRLSDSMLRSSLSSSLDSSWPITYSELNVTPAPGFTQP